MLTLSFGRQDKTSFLSSLRELPVAELHRLVQQRPDILLKLRVLVLELGCEEKCSRGPHAFLNFTLNPCWPLNRQASMTIKPSPAAKSLALSGMLAHLLGINVGRFQLGLLRRGFHCRAPV